MLTQIIKYSILRSPGDTNADAGARCNSSLPPGVGDQPITPWDGLYVPTKLWKRITDQAGPPIFRVEGSSAPISGLHKDRNAEYGPQACDSEGRPFL